MKAVFRVDASATMGTGHLTRCRTLAHELRNYGAEVQFVCRKLSGNRIADLRDEGFRVHELPAPDEGRLQKDGDYAAWLGVTQAEDASETIAVLTDQPDWLIVDHYALDLNWEQQLRPYVQNLMVIDDLANRDHDCDVLLDQNYSSDPEIRYNGRVPNEAIQLLGPRYALLQPEYAAYRVELSPHSGQASRIFIFFGGTDPENLTGLSLQALAQSGQDEITVDAIVGPNNPNREALAEQAKRMPNLTIYSPRPHLADLMANADLAIGAGGTTTWERCCLGLPSVVVSIADNQKPACHALSHDNVIHYAGHYQSVSAQKLRSVIMELVGSQETLKRLSRASMQTVDGVGGTRVATQLLSITDSQREVS